jgi:hypothetical protein
MCVCCSVFTATGLGWKSPMGSSQSYNPTESGTWRLETRARGGSG